METNKLNIQVFGSGCPTCKKLFELTSKAIAELGLDTKVEYITDIQKIVSSGIMQMPALAINGKPVMTGLVPNLEKIKTLIKENI
ncbi:MAG: thioredoxin family protein [Patescibacteria group bacterium]